MPRLFVAVWPPDEVLDRLAALTRPHIEGMRWTDRHQWHVTLRFLGPVADVEPVHAALHTVGTDATPATAVLGPAVGRFGQRVLHVPVAGLDELAATVVAATAELGRPPDDRPFSGHLTLGCAAKHAKLDLRPLTRTTVEARWEVGSVCLVESRLSPAGAHYEVVDEVALRPPPRTGAGAGGPAHPTDGGPGRAS